MRSVERTHAVGSRRSERPGWLRSRSVSVTLGLISMMGLAGCSMPAAIEANEELVADRIDGNASIESHVLEQPNCDLHYRAVGRADEAVVLWIHGTPGGWSDIAGLMVDDAFTTRARLVSIDRPGWGGSQFRPKPRMAGTFAEHSELLEPLLRRLKAQYPDVPLIAAGHSWGAPMAAVLGADHPTLVDGVLALAGPFDPSLRILRWYNYAGRLPVVSWLIGAGLRNSNKEMFRLEGEVDEAQEQWRSLAVPLIVVHGEEDSIVPVAHAAYAASLFDPAQTHILRLPQQGHLLQFERTALIGRCALALARKDPAGCRER